jgi:hypothetical protein
MTNITGYIMYFTERIVLCIYGREKKEKERKEKEREKLSISYLEAFVCEDSARLITEK